MSNKKSQLEDWLPTMTLLVLLVFLFLYLLLPNISEKEKMKEKIEFQSLGINSEQFLLDYLRTSFELEDLKNTNIADAINYYFINPDENLLKQIEIKTNEFFSETDLESDISSWSLDITHKRKKITIDSEKVRSIMRQTDYILHLKSKDKVSEISIPSPFTDELAQIKLFRIEVG